jgi:hypothetical protein
VTPTSTTPSGRSRAAGGYAISLSNATSEALVENSIIMKANKVMVARSAGTASVFGYNYADDGFILGSEGWIEVGLNASHMVGPHHVLFEGNYGFNFDSDKTHGNAIYHTVFRNHLSGVRRDFGDSGSGNGPKRAAGAAFYSYWHSFVGNVLGAGTDGGWVYESGNMDQPAIFLLGWDDWAPYPTDPKVAATTIRHGNFDYVTNSVKWDPSIATRPAELALPEREARLLRRGPRLHLAVGRSHGRDEALHAPGEGAVRQRDAVRAALTS